MLTGEVLESSFFFFFKPKYLQWEEIHFSSSLSTPIVFKFTYK